jgi:uncharacterized protein with ParB-like and HNH nuclease domain
MENGTLAVPAFQRGYVWDRQAVKELFESINNGYPIGILIAVEHDTEHFESASSELTFFPKLNSDKLVSSKRLWIIDGSQRLASLYNVFLGKNSSFTLLYDLENKKFMFPQEAENTIKFLNMSSLFKTENFMEQQANIAKNNDEFLLEELYSIFNKFKDYQIPIQVIAEVKDQDIVNIFTAMNTSGISLSEDEMQRAQKYNKST